MATTQAPTVVQTFEFDPSKLQLLPTIAGKGVSRGPTTYNGNKWLLQSEMLKSPFGLAVRNSSFDADKKTGSIPLSLPEGTPLRSVATSLMEVLKQEAVARPNEFIKSNNSDVVAHAMAKLFTQKDQKYDPMIYPKVYLDKNNLPAVSAFMPNLEPVDPSAISKNAYVSLLMEVNYYVKNAKETGWSIYVRQIRVHDIGGDVYSTPLMV